MAHASETNDYKGNAQMALEYLATANDQFQKQGMDPWQILVALEQAKALADLQQRNAVYSMLQQAKVELQRFPVFASHMHQTAGQLQMASKDPDGPESFRKSIEAAVRSRLHLRAELLTEMYGAHFKGEMGDDT
jgi:hypothetical protein